MTKQVGGYPVGSAVERLAGELLVEALAAALNPPLAARQASRCLKDRLARFGSP